MSMTGFIAYCAFFYCEIAKMYVGLPVQKDRFTITKHTIHD